MQVFYCTLVYLYFRFVFFKIYVLKSKNNIFLDKYPIETIELPNFRYYPPGLPSVAWNPWTDIRRRDDIGYLNISFPYGRMPGLKNRNRLEK